MGITRPRSDGGVTRKAPGAFDPAVVFPPSGCQIFYGYARYEPIRYGGPALSLDFDL